MGRVPPPRPPMKWAYGVTTVPGRFDSLLPKTLASLAGGGFDLPRLFVDGVCDPAAIRQLGPQFEVTHRQPNIRTFGNWALGLAELFIREPTAERYAMFQDDLVAVRNLKEYLTKLTYEDKTYWNLYTMPENEALAPKLPNPDLRARKTVPGFHASNQCGRGALALVFNQKAVIDLLTSLHMIQRPMHAIRGWRSIDGGILTALQKAGYRELVHNPSLVQHTGLTASTMGNRMWPLSETFPGEQCDALELLTA